MKFWFMIFFLMAKGCATELDYADVFATNTIEGPLDLRLQAVHFLNYCREFHVKCKVYDLYLHWEDSLPDDKAGICKVDWDGPRLIQDISILKSIDSQRLGILIAHEMTHCTRFVAHHPGDEPHVMRSYLLSPMEYTQKSYHQWMKELFKWNLPLEQYK